MWMFLSGLLIGIILTYIVLKSIKKNERLTDRDEKYIVLEAGLQNEFDENKAILNLSVSGIAFIIGFIKVGEPIDFKNKCISYPLIASIVFFIIVICLSLLTFVLNRQSFLRRYKDQEQGRMAKICENIKYILFSCSVLLIFIATCSYMVIHGII